MHNNSHCTTDRGVTFDRPTGWSSEPKPDAVFLEVPGEDIRVAIFDSRANTSDQAVQEAWVQLNPKFQRRNVDRQNELAREGWEEITSYGYETSLHERNFVSAMAFRSGHDWTVFLLSGSEQAFERQKAQVRMMMQSLRPAGFVPESFHKRSAATLDRNRIRQLTDFIERSMEISGIPGSAVGLVQGGRVVFEGGFGARKLNGNELVTPDTLFLVASNTKQFTTLLLAKLVEEGKLSWDTPVIEVFPGFKLGDESTTQKVQIRHLVSASTGLPRRDTAWMVNYKMATPESVLDLLKALRPTTAFGAVYQYSNILGAAAGYIAGHVMFPNLEIGSAYDEAMRTRILGPLGMKSTTFDYGRVLVSNHASPHVIGLSGLTVPTTFDLNPAAIPMRPGLGLWTNVRDLMRYVQMELDQGLFPDGSRYIQENALLSRRKPGVAFGENSYYGMGLVVRAQRGVAIVDHGGSYVGYRSNIFWLPEYGVGGAILTNSDNGDIPVFSFVNRVLEVLFDGRAEAELEVAHASQLRREKSNKFRKSLTVPPESGLVDVLASSYHNEILGTIKVHKGSKIVFELGDWKSSVGSRRVENSISFVPLDPGAEIFEFILAERGEATVLLLREVQHEYVFSAGS